MSVLLEALKKAAEDKKKALENSEQSSEKAIDLSSDLNSELTASKNTVADVNAISEQTDSLSASLALSDKKNQPFSGVDNESKKKGGDEKPFLSSQESAEVDASEASLTFMLKPSSIQEFNSTDTEISNTSLKKVTNEEQPKLKLVLEDTPVEQNVESDLVDKATTQAASLTDNVNVMTEVEDSIETFNSSVVKESERALEQKETSEVLKKNKTEHQVIDKKDDELLSSEQTLDSGDLIKPLGDISSEYVNNVLDDNNSSLTESKKEKTVEAVDTSILVSDMKPEDSESFKWSLDSLPGYLKLGKEKTNKSSAALNPILVSGALSYDPRQKPRQSSSKLILVLLMILVFIGIIFYGILYYQTEYESVESSMKKYNLVKTKITEQEIKSTTDMMNKNVEKIVHSPTDLTQKREVPYFENKKSVDAIKPQNGEGTGGIKSLNEERASLLEAKDTIESNSPTSKMIHPIQEYSKNNDFMAPKTSQEKSVLNKPNKAMVVVHTEKDVLSEAYLYYEKGNYMAARKAFKAVLKINPSNEFALIGLGNIATTEQSYLDAMIFYQQALAAHPSSLHAFEAIANIAGFVELNEEWKTSLLEMIRDYPESATLQYALGNLYAGEQDWLLAQKFYFQAVSLEPDNANYIMNLAVSLDQLGKYKLAAQHYTKALSFVDTQVVNFDKEHVKNRLISIKQFIVEKNL